MFHILDVIFQITILLITQNPRFLFIKIKNYLLKLDFIILDPDELYFLNVNNLMHQKIMSL